MVDEMAPLRSAGFSDPGWEHGVAIDERKKKVKCNYCGKIVSGGIYRLKQHLARISGEVTYCKKAPEEVYLKMKENLEGYRASKRRRYEEEESFDLHSNDDDDEEDEIPIGYKSKGKEVSCDRGLVVSMAPLRSLGFVDPGWEHGVAQDEKKKKVKCNYCEKVVSGGINRFKQHLARIPGEVAYCKRAPEEVYLKMKENMKYHRTGRRGRPEAKELSAFHMQSENDDEEEFANGRTKTMQLLGNMDASISKALRKNHSGRSPSNGNSETELQLKHINLDSMFSKTQKSHTPQRKPSKIKTDPDRKNHKEVISAICKFFYYAAIPFNAANSPYFHRMLDLVGQYGQGLKYPSGRVISGQFLQDEVGTLREYLAEVKASWTITGCTVMADSWKDVHGRILINFLVSCPRGVYFISSVDATDIVEDVNRLFSLLDKIVEEVGEENIVQVITENSPCYKAAGKMLEEKRRSLFWMPCAAYCLDQILEEFVKIKWVGDCMAKSQRITKLIYNCAWLLNFMKKECTAGKELLKPAVTKFATSFVILQSLLDHRVSLKRMFQSTKWISSQLAKSDEGKEVEKIVLNATFWKKVQYVKKSVDPVIDVLQKVENHNGLSMPFIYNDIYRAKVAIRTIHGGDERKYGPFWNALDRYWDSIFHHPLYVAAYFLNPSYRYRPDFMALPEVIRGLNECITRLEPDNGRRVSAVAQISDFVFAKADFGTELALSTRMELDPASWWQQHGINCLELQHIAIKILSQTCSSIGCEHSWSAFDLTYNKRRNRLAQKRLSDLTYVHYNLRIREKQSKRMADESISLESVLLESLLNDWIIETERSPQQEEEILFSTLDHSETYENDMNETGVVDADSRKGHANSVALRETMMPLEVNPVIVDAPDEDGADLDFLDHDDLRE